MIKSLESKKANSLYQMNKYKEKTLLSQSEYISQENLLLYTKSQAKVLKQCTVLNRLEAH